MLRFAPRIGVSLLVTLLFGPLSSTAHDSDDKSFEGTWSVIVAGHITWTGEDHQDCVHRATVTSGQCVRRQPQLSHGHEGGHEGGREGESNQYCPEVTPGFTDPARRGDELVWAHCLIRTQHDSDR